jgi:glycosyltransferase involved in cell wall biosynthesis
MQVERPRVSLNAQLLRINEGYRSAGIARYQLHLLRELPHVATDFQFDVFSTEELAPALLDGLNVRSSRVPAHRPLARIFWEQVILPWHLLRDKYALFHSLAYVSPILNRTPTLVTLYDLSFFRYPQYFRPFHRLYLQLGSRISVRRARRLTTISESTKRDVMRLFGIDGEIIDVAPPGVDSMFLRGVDKPQLEAFRRERDLPARFILFMGTREPRKNIPALLKAFASVKQRIRAPHSLVIAGGRGWLDEEIPHVLEELHLSRDVLFPGYVPDAELPLWYRLADVFVYPSQYEGFGMPVLEALASGTPVITSNVSSLPEAAGDAAITVDPGSPEEIAAALVRVLTDSALCEDLAVRGPRQARQFTWAQTARLVAGSYRRALGLAPLPVLNPALS